MKLSDNEILYFSKIMLRYEGEIKTNPKGYNINDKELKKFIRNNNIRLEYKMKCTQYKEEKNTIFFSKCDDSVCVSFMRHIRNAFAHNNIVKERNSYILTDKWHKNLTMNGRIGTNLLKDLIAKMEETRKPQI